MDGSLAPNGTETASVHVLTAPMSQAQPRSVVYMAGVKAASGSAAGGDAEVPHTLFPENFCGAG